MKQKIYIAGKVTGLPIAECTMNFGLVQKQIEDLGYEAVNPLAVVNDWNCSWGKAMRLCIAALMECDMILVLDNHKDSPGAKLEIELAHKLRMPILYDVSHLERCSQKGY